jgi:hypothetical protein
VTYKITSTIAASGTLTPGTNATAVKVGDELSSISSDLAPKQVGSTITTLGGAINIFRAGNVVSISLEDVSVAGSFAAPKPCGNVYCSAPLLQGTSVNGYVEHRKNDNTIWRTVGVTSSARGWGSISYIAE